MTIVDECIIIFNLISILFKEWNMLFNIQISKFFSNHASFRIELHHIFSKSFQVIFKNPSDFEMILQISSSFLKSIFNSYLSQFIFLFHVIFKNSNFNILISKFNFGNSHIHFQDSKSNFKINSNRISKFNSTLKFISWSSFLFFTSKFSKYPSSFWNLLSF